jgi:ribosome-interacting GTPase 1
MPTNLPPEYFDAEELYKAAETPQEKIARLEELISTVPKHKGTDKLRADLRKRLSKLKSAAETRKGSSRHVSAYTIEREGAGQVAVVGPPNVGKSSLVTALTNASPEIDASPFTTWAPTPGMMHYKHVPIQLIDTPPLHRTYVEPAFMDLLRRCDILLLLLDLETDPPGQMQESVELLAEHNILPAQEGIDSGKGARLRYVPFLYAVNKYDDQSDDELWEIVNELMTDDLQLLPISAKSGRNLDLLGKMIIAQGSTVVEFAEKVHRDFHDQLKSARVWGSASFDGQAVSRDHVLRDGDIVELRI